MSVVGTVTTAAAGTGDHGRTVTRSEPASGPGVATPDEFLVTMRDRDHPEIPATAVAVPGTRHSHEYGVMFANRYDVRVYAVNQSVGTSLPATAVGVGPGLPVGHRLRAGRGRRGGR